MSLDSFTGQAYPETGQMARKTFKFRLYPNRQQRERFTQTLDVCRELYNAGLQERIAAAARRRQRKAQVHDGNAKSVPGKAGEYERGPPEARTEVLYLTRTMTRVMSSLWGAPEAKASAALIILAMESFAGSPLQFEMASRRRWSPHSSRVGFMASLKPSV
jgi:hypothetical protein